jgi:hypothetical protein
MDSSERFCLTAGIGALEQMLCEDAPRSPGSAYQDRIAVGIRRMGKRREHETSAVVLATWAPFRELGATILRAFGPHAPLFLAEEIARLKSMPNDPPQLEQEVLADRES